MVYPKFYDAGRVGKIFVPDVQTIVAEARQSGLAPASDDVTRKLLILVDMQVDFVHDDGALSVPGAVEDTRRVIDWLFRNIGEVTTIAASLDSHVPVQIFLPTWWVDADGNHPAPFTAITWEDVEAERWQPLYLPEWSREYVKTLAVDAKKDLMIWPFHTLIGTQGHTITPALYEAIAYHAAARQTQPVFLSKGSIPQTEHYSMLEPEVKVPDQAMGTLNTAFLEMMASYDEIYIAGEAKSHCVLETVASYVRYFDAQPDMIGKLRLLTDCMSSVAHPVVDFDAMADAAFAEFAGKGVQLVRSV